MLHENCHQCLFDLVYPGAALQNGVDKCQHPYSELKLPASQARAASYEMCSELAPVSCDRQKTCTVSIFWVRIDMLL